MFSLRTSNCERPAVLFFILYAAIPPPPAPNNNAPALKVANTASKAVDDVVGASAVHGMCGLWGMIAVGLFHEKMGILMCTVCV